MEISVRELTTKEYEEVNTKGIKNPSIYDIKKMVFDFEISFSKYTTYRNINVPLNIIWKRNLNSIDGERCWFRFSYTKDNGDESSAKYHKEFVFYSKGVSEGQIRKAFESSNIRVSYQTNDGVSSMIEYSIGNNIDFKK